MGPAPNESPSGHLFDLDAISKALETLNMWRAEDDSSTPQEELYYDDAEHRMLQGYAFVDDLLFQGHDPFVYGGSHFLLEMNHLVLCGRSPRRREEFAPHIDATTRRFYEDHDVGADSFCAWAQEHRHLQPLPFAARLYRRIVGAPQLFIEGNQRTATLVVSYVLGRAAMPPLVRTAKTFEAFATMSGQCKAVDRRRFSTALWGQLLDWRLENFISRAVDERFLVAARRNPAPGAALRPVQPREA